MNDLQMMMLWWGDRAWWVIESVFLRLPDKGFWARLGYLPPDMPRRPETWVSLCNLMLKLRGISHSSAILGSDSPQSNNRKVTQDLMSNTLLPVIKATTAYNSACTDARAAFAPLFSGGTRVCQCPKIMARYEAAAASLG